MEVSVKRESTVSDKILQTTNVHVPLVGPDDQAIKS